MVDCDKTFAIRLTHENALPKDLQEASIQCALLYTTAEGQRRIRLHTMSVPVSTQLGVVFRNADVDAVIAMSLKQTVLRIPMCTHAQVCVACSVF
jgi:protein transport protein SEC24